MNTKKKVKQVTKKAKKVEKCDGACSSCDCSTKEQKDFEKFINKHFKAITKMISFENKLIPYINKVNDALVVRMATMVSLEHALGFVEGIITETPAKTKEQKAFKSALKAEAIAILTEATKSLKKL